MQWSQCEQTCFEVRCGFGCAGIINLNDRSDDTRAASAWYQMFLHRTYRTGVHGVAISACTFRRIADKAEATTRFSARARRAPIGRKAFDQFRNFVASIVAGESGAKFLRALSISRVREHGPNRLANLRASWPAGAKIDAGARPRDPRGYFRLILAIAGNDQGHTETERLSHGAITAVGHHDTHLREQAVKRQERPRPRIGRQRNWDRFDGRAAGTCDDDQILVRQRR